MTLPQSAIDLILISEGVDQPWKWPGGGSGITLGFGVDIGADPAGLEHWRGVLADTELHTLKQALGITGRRAQEIQTRFRGINVSRAQSLYVFTRHTLPTEIARTLRAFPGVAFMPPAVLGALVSVVFNRGTSITDSHGSSRRREMRIIHEILADFATMTDFQRTACMRQYAGKIALQIRSMKRLWIGQGLDGLLTRRDAEADLVESATTQP